MTLTQTVEIPESRRLHLDLEIPLEIPAGAAQVEFKVIPFVKEGEKSEPSTERAKASEGSPLAPQEKYEPPLKCLIGVETPLTNSLLGCISNPENKTYDELRFEGMLDKYGEYFK